jgi:hypothetical protein
LDVGKFHRLVAIKVETSSSFRECGNRERAKYASVGYFVNFEFSSSQRTSESLLADSLRTKLYKEPDHATELYCNMSNYVNAYLQLPDNMPINNPPATKVIPINERLNFDSGAATLEEVGRGGIVGLTDIVGVGFPKKCAISAAMILCIPYVE